MLANSLIDNVKLTNPNICPEVVHDLTSLYNEYILSKTTRLSSSTVVLRQMVMYVVEIQKGKYCSDISF
jgi:hypothetical protein